MKKEDLSRTIAVEKEQVMRSTKTEYFPKKGLTMIIETFARVYKDRIKDEHIHISFYDSNNKITSGPIWEALKDLYYKPEYVQW